MYIYVHAFIVRKCLRTNNILTKMLMQFLELKLQKICLKKSTVWFVMCHNKEY